MKFLRINGLCIALLTAFLPMAGYAVQNTGEKLSLDKGPLSNQFDYVIKESSDYLEFKVVKTWWLQKLKSHVNDSVNAYKKQMNEMQQSVIQNNLAMDSMVVAMQAVDSELSTALKDKNSIRFIGIKMDKSVYNGLMWSITGILLVLMFAFFILYKRSNVITVQTKKDLDEIRNEFETHRKKSLEREEQIVRKMYDEILKYKNKTVTTKGTA